MKLSEFLFHLYLLGFVITDMPHQHTPIYKLKARGIIVTFRAGNPRGGIIRGPQIDYRDKLTFAEIIEILSNENQKDF